MKKVFVSFITLIFILCICGCEEINFSSDIVLSTDTSDETIETIDLPKVVFSANDSNIRYEDVISLDNGGFAIAGQFLPSEDIQSVIRIYDKNAVLTGEYLFHDGNGFDKIVPCSDGGFIAASYCPPCITKINNKFETEWFQPYENVEFEGTVTGIAELTPEKFAVLFVTNNAPNLVRTLKISILNRAGELIETIDLMKNIDPQDAKIVADGNGGFYLFSACNEDLAKRFDFAFDQSKATEVMVLHFSADLKPSLVKTLGGGGNDWVEEAAVDKEGNFYLAIGTDWYGADSLWDMSVERIWPYRRMLVKLNKDGNILYKVPLSNKGMAVDQIFGVHIKDNKAYVVGMADYFDGYQVKYPCEQIDKTEKGDRVFCVFTACIDNDGNELNRSIFRCDINNTPSASAMLNNGSIIIGGSVSGIDNPFNLGFETDDDTCAAIFVYS